MEFGPRRAHSIRTLQYNTVFGSRRASIRSSRHGVRVQACSAASGAGGEVRVTRHSKGGDEEKEEEESYLC